MSEDSRVDEVTDIETTGHEWDGIEELNRPLPRWWLWTFYATILFSVIYCILYPAWPTAQGEKAGVLNYSSREQLEQAVAAVEAGRAETIAKIRDLPFAEIRRDPVLMQVALKGGESAYKVNCVQCHGAGAAGGPGYPNLNDDAWLWGGTPEAIHTTLQYGIRHDEYVETRYSEMPAFGRDNLLQRDQIKDVVAYVQALSGRGEMTEAAKRGTQIYAEQCAVCHGDSGEGNRDLGAPTLNDAIWLYGGDDETLYETVANARYGVMPGWANRLDAATLKQLTLYVHSLGGGERPETQQAQLQGTE
ncbi:MAG: cytochrome-c oxidase, cbb3-type subunit III [Rhodothalassiaceae bacterium]